ARSPRADGPAGRCDRADDRPRPPSRRRSMLRCRTEWTAGCAGRARPGRRAAAAARRRHPRDSADRAWTLEVEIYQWLTFEVIGLAACSIFGIYSGPTYDP